MKRRATFVICGLDALAWMVIAIPLFFSAADPATSGLDMAAAIFVTILFALTAIPAALLARAGRAPNLALGAALAFPAAFLMLLAAVVLLFSFG